MFSPCANAEPENSALQRQVTVMNTGLLTLWNMVCVIPVWWVKAGGAIGNFGIFGRQQSGFDVKIPFTRRADQQPNNIILMSL